MQTWTQLSWKKFGNLEPGELARVTLGGEKALILKLDDDAAGVLHSDGNHHGMWLQPRASLNCISFGSNWFLDIEPDSKLFPENSGGCKLTSLLCLDSEGFVFQFQSPPEKLADGLCYSITTGEITEHPTNRAAPVEQWSIWESEKHRIANGTGPLFRYIAKV